MNKKQPDKIITVTSGYGANTHVPFVEIAMDYPEDHPLQLGTDEARHLAHSIIEAAEAAEQDEFMFVFLKSVLGGGDPIRGAEMAAHLLGEYRTYRNAKRKGST